MKLYLEPSEAEQPGMMHYGTSIEAALVRGFRLEGGRTPEFVNGVKLLSDHHKCMLARARYAKGSVPICFYNLAPAGDPGRGPAQVRKELLALMNNQPHDASRLRPLLGWSEGVDRRLPALNHAQLIQSSKTPGRKNVGLYVPNRYVESLGKIEWLDHKVSWPRVLHPGAHDPRATLFVEMSLEAGDTLVGVGHGPQAPNPRLSKAEVSGLVEARKEWVELVAGRLQDEKRFIFLSDPNGLMDELMRALN